MIGLRNLVQKLLDKQKEKLLDKQKVPDQPNQTQILFLFERGDPLIAENTSRSSAQEIDTHFSHDCKNAKLEEAKHDRTGRPVVCREPVGSHPTPNEVEIDFRVSGLPHSVVKQA